VEEVVRNRISVVILHEIITKISGNLSVIGVHYS